MSAGLSTEEQRELLADCIEQRAYLRALVKRFAVAQRFEEWQMCVILAEENAREIADLEASAQKEASV